MNPKLQAGDYVKNLSKKQWDEIMEFQPKPFLKLTYTEYYAKDGFALSVKGLFIDYNDSRFKIRSTNELTFDEFLLRAKNTFQS